MKNENIFNAISNISPEYLEKMSFEETTVTPITPVKHSKLPVIAVICAIVGLTGITCFAASRFNLGRGGNKLQIDESQQQELIQTSAAIVYTSENTSAELSSTINADDITVVPVSVVADERCAFISFKISGFTFDETKNEPFFIQTYVYEDESMEVELKSIGSFYDGINLTFDGFVYEDGTPVQTYENGSQITHYFDSDGCLCFELRVTSHNIDTNLLGKRLYIKLADLAEIWKCDVIYNTGKEWCFTLDMPTESTSIHKEAGQKIEGTSLYLDSIDISPVSVKLNYTYEDAASLESMPKFAGVILKDGTALGVGDDVLNGFDSQNAYSNCYFTQAIVPENVESIIIFPDMDDGSTLITIPVH